MFGFTRRGEDGKATGDGRLKGAITWEAFCPLCSAWKSPILGKLVSVLCQNVVNVN